MPEPLRQRYLDPARVVVVKIGSAVLTRDGRLHRPALARLGAEIAELRRTGRRVIIVSSGAVASGLQPLGLSSMPKAIVDKQAAAAVGQQILMAAWAEAFRKERVAVAQVLLTADDLDHRTRYLNARHTLQNLLHHGVVPIVNENDSVSYDEIKMGDNDHLSALVTLLVSADLLIMLTVVDGLRRGGLDGPVIPLVAADDEVSTHVARGKSATGIGGMATKVAAAALVGRSGVPAIIAPGTRKGVLRTLISGEEVGTLFEPRTRRLDPRRRWLATATRARGSLLVDDGARRALVERKASLLPAGIVRVEGRFASGAVVRICDAAGEPFARGLVSYASDEIDRVRGCKGAELPQILGYRYVDEIVHRNDMVIEKS
ncbi:MAG TPA: glutamate 5-kinase [Phycisphaerae bacterium]|nr:glutamate 5-kinase [Phycisphaerae bacterium]